MDSQTKEAKISTLRKHVRKLNAGVWWPPTQLDLWTQVLTLYIDLEEIDLGEDTDISPAAIDRLARRYPTAFTAAVNSYWDNAMNDVLSALADKKVAEVASPNCRQSNTQSRTEVRKISSDHPGAIDRADLLGKLPTKH